MSEREQTPPDHTAPGSQRICIAYDRLYPWSIGGAERWYRLLAGRLAHRGHRVLYVTARHWEESEKPDLASVRVVTVSSTTRLYGRERRRMLPVVRYALGLWWHLLRHGRHYDVVQASAMSSLAALGAASLAPLHHYRLVLDWWEVWTAAYWRSYAGPIAGSIGWFAQWILSKVRHQPIAYSELHAQRLRALRRGDAVPVVRGLLECSAANEAPLPADSLIVSAGRLIPEKQILSLVPALAVARERLPELRATIFGEGPELATVKRAVANAGLAASIKLPGFVADDCLTETLQRAMCVVHLSRREGYGLIVAEAAALGVPSVVLRHPDSAAAELIVDDVNGITCTGTTPEEIASAILHVHDAGDALRQSTLAWFRAHARELTIESSLPRMLAIYQGVAAQGRSRV